ncbi:mechanosensitive ion channel family protein [Maribellus maritimus]|uniref:mechanosensitive ion channel family protein n=1 Tax=Maribellus maritimus TaxID=2870838 RepID=UPI001EEA34E8|nr:mechanosensitive ion channel domain-containing protein [Maribellus maritimus]MCG6185940.1 mechanosensitive ion channel family protein [Maribellus maritimus]
MDAIRTYLTETTGLTHESLNKIILSLVIIFILWLLRLIILRIVWRQTKNVKTRYQWKRSISMIIPFIGIILVGSVWVQAFRQFGAFLGLFSAGLAIALKDPLTNLAGWFFIMFRKPFIVGDRVQIGEHAGDVIDIRLFQFTILEIGNWVEADQSTGRIIHLPNGKVFMEAQANYSTGFEFIWNEIKVTLTFESNWEKGKNILQQIINEHAEHISKDAEKEIFKASRNYMIYYHHLTPIVYTKVKDFGVQLTIRYLCNPRKRRGSENEIWQNILLQFKNHDDIQFAYPTTRFYKYGEEKN